MMKFIPAIAQRRRRGEKRGKMSFRREGMMLIYDTPEEAESRNPAAISVVMSRSDVVEENVTTKARRAHTHAQI